MAVGRKYNHPEVLALVGMLERQLGVLIRSSAPFTYKDLITKDIVKFAAEYPKEVRGLEPELDRWLNKLANNVMKQVKYRGKIFKVWDRRLGKLVRDDHATLYWGSNIDPRITEDELKLFVPAHLRSTEALRKFVEPPIRKATIPSQLSALPDPVAPAPEATRAVSVDWKAIAMASIDVAKTLMLQLEAIQDSISGQE